ncbi:MAG: hypothetical protein K2P88_15385 [Chitinophagaceae bacterium]|uniref:hypothetical protein n=1 Tax=unclassified Paraflavitalea TaxID=2798305 RepID=UPI003D34C048|nr:hypothetical protein [Chitinophagaceae bacterium]
MVAIRIISIFLALFCGVLTVGFYREWFHVGIDGGITAYPWGQIADNPWYYSTPQVYAKYQLLCAGIFSVYLLFWFHAFYTYNNLRIKWSVVLGIVLIFLQYFSGKVA